MTDSWKETARSMGVKLYALQHQDDYWNDRWDIYELFDTLEEARAAFEKMRLCRGHWRIAEGRVHIDYEEEVR